MEKERNQNSKGNEVTKNNFVKFKEVSKYEFLRKKLEREKASANMLGRFLKLLLFPSNQNGRERRKRDGS